MSARALLRGPAPLDSILYSDRPHSLFTQNNKFPLPVFLAHLANKIPFHCIYRNFHLMVWWSDAKTRPSTGERARLDSTRHWFRWCPILGKRTHSLWGNVFESETRNIGADSGSHVRTRRASGQHQPKLNANGKVANAHFIPILPFDMYRNSERKVG